MMSNELDTETNAIKKKQTNEKNSERRISFDELYKIHIDGWCSTVCFPRYVSVPEENIETSFSISFRKSTILSSNLFSPRFAVERTQLQFSSLRQHTQWTMNITFYVVNEQKKNWKSLHLFGIRDILPIQNEWCMLVESNQMQFA